MTADSMKEMKLPWLTHVNADGVTIARMADPKTKSGNALVSVSNTSSSGLLSDDDTA